MAEAGSFMGLLEYFVGLPSPWFVFLLTMLVMLAISVPQIGLLQFGYYVYTSPLGIGRLIHELQRWNVGNKRHTITSIVAKEGEPLAVSLVPALADNYQYVVLETVALRRALSKPKPTKKAQNSLNGDDGSTAKPVGDAGNAEGAKRECSAIVVDPSDAPRIIEEIETLERKYDCRVRVEALLLTHYHLDHVGGAGELLRSLEARNQTRPQVVAPLEESGRIAVAVDIPAKDTLEDDQHASPEYAATRASMRVDDLAGPKAPQGSLRFGEGMLVHPMAVGCHTPGHTAFAIEWRNTKSRVRAHALAQGKTISGAATPATAGKGKGKGSRSSTTSGSSSSSSSCSSQAASAPLNDPSADGTGLDDDEIVLVDGMVNGMWGRCFFFTGDALFAGGVGRFFEGTALQLALSLLQIVRAGAIAADDEPESERAIGLREGIKPMGSGDEPEEPHVMLLKQQRAVATNFAPTVLEGSLDLWNPQRLAVLPSAEAAAAEDLVKGGVWQGWTGICSPLVEADIDVNEVQIHSGAFASTSLSRLSRVAVFPGHEYTEENLKFARWAEPENMAVFAKLQWATARRAGKPTCEDAIPRAREERETREEEALKTMVQEGGLDATMQITVQQELDGIRQRRAARAAESQTKDSPAGKGASSGTGTDIPDGADGKKPKTDDVSLQTVPSTLQEELLTNPFVRALVPGTWIASRMDLIAAIAEREDMLELDPLPAEVRLPQAIKTVVLEAREKSNNEMVPLLQDIVREAQEQGDNAAIQKEMLVRGVVARSVLRLWILRCLKNANVHRQQSGVSDWQGPSWVGSAKYLREMEDYAQKQREQLVNAKDEAEEQASMAKQVFGDGAVEASASPDTGEGESDDSDDGIDAGNTTAGAQHDPGHDRGQLPLALDASDRGNDMDEDEDEDEDFDEGMLDALNAEVPLD